MKNFVLCTAHFFDFLSSPEDFIAFDHRHFPAPLCRHKDTRHQSQDPERITESRLIPAGSKLVKATSIKIVKKTAPEKLLKTRQFIEFQEGITNDITGELETDGGYSLTAYGICTVNDYKRGLDFWYETESIPPLMSNDDEILTEWSDRIKIYCATAHYQNGTRKQLFTKGAVVYKRIKQYLQHLPKGKQSSELWIEKERAAFLTEKEVDTLKTYRSKSDWKWTIDDISFGKDHLGHIWAKRDKSNTVSYFLPSLLRKKLENLS